MKRLDKAVVMQDHQSSDGDDDHVLGSALVRLHRIANVLPPASVVNIVEVVAGIVGARAGRL